VDDRASRDGAFKLKREAELQHVRVFLGLEL